jgi:hypothetical protein
VTLLEESDLAGEERIETLKGEVVDVAFSVRFDAL